MKKSILILLVIIMLLLQFGPLWASSRYELWCDSTLLRASTDSAEAQVGTLELTCRNDGARVESYLASVGLTKGNPYCAAGQYWCFFRASIDLDMSPTSIPIKRTGSANEMFVSASKLGKRTRFMPMRDDLIVWRIGKTAFGHIERIIKVGKGGNVLTVGFNTSSGTHSERNGEGVFLRRRNIYSALGSMKVRGLIGFQYSEGIRR